MNKLRLNFRKREFKLRDLPSLTINYFTFNHGLANDLQFIGKENSKSKEASCAGNVRECNLVRYTFSLSIAS